MKRILIGLVAAIALAGSASAQEIISYRAPDGSTRIDVSAATPLPTANVATLPTSGGSPVSSASVPAGVVSSGNSSTATLGVSGVFTGAWEDVLPYSDIRVSVFSNVASATDGLALQFSPDGVNVDSIDNFSITAAQGKVLGAAVAARYFRVVYTNGGTLQGSFRLQTTYKAQHPKSSSIRMQDARSNDNDVEEIAAYGQVWDATNSAWQRQRGDVNGTTFQATRSTSTSTAGTTSGTINTFTTALAASATRRGCMIVNKSTNPLYVSIAASPALATSIILAAGTATTDGGVFNCAGPGPLVVTDLVSVASGTASQAYLLISQ